MYFSLLGSPSGPADTPPAAAAAAASAPVAATAVSTKHWPQISQSQRQAAKPTGTVDMLSFSDTLLFISTIMRGLGYLTLWSIQ